MTRKCQNNDKNDHNRHHKWNICYRTPSIFIFTFVCFFFTVVKSNFSLAISLDCQVIFAETLSTSFVDLRPTKQISHDTIADKVCLLFAVFHLTEFTRAKWFSDHGCAWFRALLPTQIINCYCVRRICSPITETFDIVKASIFGILGKLN